MRHNDEQTRRPPQPRHRKRFRMMRFLSLPVTAMQDCHASVKTQQNDDKKKKCRKAAIRVHKTWKADGKRKYKNYNENSTKKLDQVDSFFRFVFYLISSLCLTNENQSVGGDDGEAEVDEDD